MRTVTIKSSCNENDQTRTVTFLRDGLPVATVEVPFSQGFEWASEYACDWCSYGKLPKVSTPLDIAPPALPDPPSAIYLPLSAAEFIKLVRDGKVLAWYHGEAPVQIDQAGDGWARIGWGYEEDAGYGTYEWYYDSMNVDSDTDIRVSGDKVIVGSETFLITQP